jgi:hypothetical protein
MRQWARASVRLAGLRDQMICARPGGRVGRHPPGPKQYSRSSNAINPRGRTTWKSLGIRTLDKPTAPEL